MPRIFASENVNKVPAAALWLTNIVVQLFVISTYWSQNAFHLMLELTSSMTLIPYLLVAGYGLLVARRGEGYSSASTLRTRDAVIAAIAVIYTAFMILAGGLKYLLLSSVLYAPGTLLYYWTRREQARFRHLRAAVKIFAEQVGLESADQQHDEGENRKDLGHRDERIDEGGLPNPPQDHEVE